MGALTASALLMSCRLRYEELSSSALSGGSAGAASGGVSSTSGTDSADAGEPATTGGSGEGGGTTQPAAGGADDGGEPGAGGTPDAAGGSAGNGGATAGSGGSSGTAGAGGTGGTGGSGGTGPCTATSYGGHNYWVCTTPKPFIDAALDCAGRGYRPVRIDSAGEQTFVHDTIPVAAQNDNNTSVWRWLGATGTSGNWQWSDGQQFWTGNSQGMAVGGAYTNWSQGQPLNNQSCLAMQARSGTWNAIDCFAARPYVCEQY